MAASFKREVAAGVAAGLLLALILAIAGWVGGLTKLLATDALVAAVANQITTKPGPLSAYLAPRGTIVAWSPHAAMLGVVPQGWVICDGKNGTPDLINRFLYGADVTTADAPGGLQEFPVGRVVCGDAVCKPEHVYGVRFEQADTPGTTNIVKPHTHPLSTTGGPIPMTPPYYSVVFIMKT